MTDPTLSTEQIQALLDKSRGSHWYFQLGWGIQYSNEGGLGLLVPDGHEGAATVAEMDLMAASQQIARQYVAVVPERDALRAALTELVELKTLKDRLGHGDFLEYQNRKPTAWARAQALVGLGSEG
ncbi:hypothetical protein [Deinococcus sp. QL22]|uniref:hypothetical protein n=1 Tax=Deinococcus sp. QL22 TaxID=2939437 RepID=UPI002017FF82|nr:hypothetical protein [Deinococcus sp. QL22]UQN10312.1 hypothetical protein M1R55_29615 [Deinococcus sp. QL22]UQN10446.1 hypothetical protein M1R55_28940 [Deinococcus sp. QL22]